MKQLSKHEMKSIIGGKRATDHCTFSGLCSSFPTITYTAGEGPGADQAQATADSICMGLGSCCSDVDCPGAA